MTQDPWEQAQFDTIADALQDLLQSKNGATAGAQAIDYAITTWVDYHRKEIDKWNSLLLAIKAIHPKSLTS